MLPEDFFAWLLKDEKFFEKIIKLLSKHKELGLFKDKPKLYFMANAIVRHYAKYNTIPSISILKNEALESGENYRDIWEFIELVKVSMDNIKHDELEWALDSAIKWLKKIAIIVAIENSYEILSQKGDASYPVILKRVEEAVAIRLDDDNIHDFFKDWKRRLKYYKTPETRIEFFLPQLNAVCGGGFKKPSLNVITTRTGGGKTMFMVNQAIHLISKGYNVIYFTMEDGELAIGQRMDAVATGIPLTEFTAKKIDQKEYMLRLKRWLQSIGSKGSLIIKEFEAGAPTVIDLKTAIKDLKTVHKIEPDVIFVDYLNLMRPVLVSRNDTMYNVVGSVAVDLRGMASHFNVPVFTATQLNRSGARSSDPTTEDISESMKVAHTADFMMAMISDKDLRTTNQAIIKIIKSRYGGEQYSFPVYADPERGIITELSDSNNDKIPVQYDITGNERSELVRKAIDI